FLRGGRGGRLLGRLLALARGDESEPGHHADRESAHDVAPVETFENAETLAPSAGACRALRPNDAVARERLRAHGARDLRGDLLEDVELLERLARADHDRRERVFREE